MNDLHRRFILAGGSLLALCAAAMAEPEGDEAVIHAAIERWSEASQAKDIEAFMSVYAPEAVVMLEGAADLKGHQAIRDGLGGMMQDPHFNLFFEADEVVVSESGDMAYETGAYSLSVSDPEGNPVSQKGHYLVVWQKQDGEWKVLFDVPVSGPPEAASTE